MSRATNTHTTEITLEVEIEYVYDPGEKRVDYYPDGSGHPGTPPSVSLYEVHVNRPWGGDILHTLPQSLIDELEAENLENHDAEDDRE